MDKEQGTIDLPPTQARQASKERVVRYVLGISLVLVIIAFIIAYFVS